MRGGRGRGRGGDGPFRRHGMRLTMARQAILAALRDSDELLSAEDVFIQVRQDYDGVGIATVYRTLQLLADLGVAARVDTGDGTARYRLAEPDKPLRHVTCFCRKCGMRFAIDADDIVDAISSLESAVAENREFTVEQSVAQLVGVCSECSQSAGD